MRAAFHGIVVVAVLFGAYFAYWHYQQQRAESQASAFCESNAIGSDVTQASTRARDMKLVRHGYSEQQGRFVAVFPGAIFNAYTCELTVAEGRIASRRVVAEDD